MDGAHSANAAGAASAPSATAAPATPASPSPVSTPTPAAELFVAKAKAKTAASPTPAPAAAAAAAAAATAAAAGAGADVQAAAVAAPLFRARKPARPESALERAFREQCGASVLQLFDLKFASALELCARHKAAAEAKHARTGKHTSAFGGHELTRVLFHTALVATVRALVTEKPEHMADATRLLHDSEALAKARIDTHDRLTSTYGAVSGFVNTWSGGWMGTAVQRVEQRAPEPFAFDDHVVLAHTYVFQALVQLRAQSWFSGGLTLRSAWKQYEQCLTRMRQHAKRVSDAEAARHAVSDTDAAGAAGAAGAVRVPERYFAMSENDVLCCVGIFHFVLSMIPPSMRRLVGALGFDTAAGDFDVGRREIYHSVTADANPMAPVARCNLLWIESSFREDFALAEALYADSVAANASGALMDYLFGYMNRRTGRVKEAVANFTRAQSQGAELPEFHVMCDYELGWCHFLLNDFVRAVDLLDGFLKRHTAPSFRAYAAYQLAYAHDILTSSAAAGTVPAAAAAAPVPAVAAPAADGSDVKRAPTAAAAGVGNTARKHKSAAGAAAVAPAVQGHARAMQVMGWVPGWARERFTFDRYALRKAREYLYRNQPLAPAQILLVQASNQCDCSHYSSACAALRALCAPAPAPAAAAKLKAGDDAGDDVKAAAAALAAGSSAQRQPVPLIGPADPIPPGSVLAAYMAECDKSSAAAAAAVKSGVKAAVPLPCGADAAAEFAYCCARALRGLEQFALATAWCERAIELHQHVVTETYLLPHAMLEIAELRVLQLQQLVAATVSSPAAGAAAAAAAAGADATPADAKVAFGSGAGAANAHAAANEPKAPNAKAANAAAAAQLAMVGNVEQWLQKTVAANSVPGIDYDVPLRRRITLNVHRLRVLREALEKARGPATM